MLRMKNDYTLPPPHCSLSKLGSKLLVDLAQTYDRIAHQPEETNLYSRNEYREAAFRLRETARAKLDWDL